MIDWKLFWIFVILNIINVIIQTIKSIATVKCGKSMAALVNAIAYGLYTVVVVYMVCDLPLWLKVVVIAVCNLIGVFFVKWGEEKARKDKLWKVEATIPHEWTGAVHFDLKDVPHNYVENVGKYTLFNFYCATQKESAKVRDILAQYEAKYFVSESKTL
jgi:uncharacterized protein YebE (UPF0316 family)